jgi:hypothetical protein
LPFGHGNTLIAIQRIPDTISDTARRNIDNRSILKPTFTELLAMLQGGILGGLVWGHTIGEGSFLGVLIGIAIILAIWKREHGVKLPK